MPGFRAISCPPRQPADRGERGFSFVEILFAIAVLGIGFIMLAAIFPVGLQQTKLTLDETTAAGNARGAVAVISQLAQSQTQYRNLGVAADDTNSTYILPHTYSGPYPVAGTAAGELPLNQTRIFAGQVRSLREGRNFTDAWNPGIPTVQPTPHEMTAPDILLRRNAIWNRVSTELLSKSNERNAFVVLYKRDVSFTNVNNVISFPKPADSAQLIVINTQVANQSAYTAKDSMTITPDPVPLIYNLEPRPVGVTIQLDSEVGGYVARFSSIKGTVATPLPGDHTNFSSSPVYDAATAAVAEGAYVVISDDNITTPGLVGSLNGRIFRLGNYRTDITTPGYELSPGFDYAPEPGLNSVRYKAGGTGLQLVKDDITAIGYLPAGPLPDEGQQVTSGGVAVAYVLGKGFDNLLYTPPGASPNFSNYVGLAQDVAVYTTFVQAK